MGKGDKGKTNIGDKNQTVLKSSPTIAVLGDIDELNSVMGLCRAKARTEGFDDMEAMVLEVQNMLFVAQAEVAGADKEIKKNHVERLEALIGKVESEIRLPQSFVVPGADELSALCDVARTVARRAERSLVNVCVVEKTSFCDSALPAFMNRMSSFWYVLARLVAGRKNVTEETPHYGTTA